MEIVPAKATDLIEILYLLKVCIADMNSKGLKHWNSSFPGPYLMQEDIDKGTIYLVKDKGVCKGMVTLKNNEPEDYRQMNLKPGKALYIQNMAVHPLWQGMGIARMMIDFARQMAAQEGCNCIRLDVFQTCEKARKLYVKQDFKEIASFHFAYQKVPFICYEKQL
jgi:ribosomal protein S18 acetylase RimI-like enzyme